jgi:PBSX family phage terminase large subunit
MTDEEDKKTKFSPPEKAKIKKEKRAAPLDREIQENKRELLKRREHARNAERKQKKLVDAQKAIDGKRAITESEIQELPEPVQEQIKQQDRLWEPDASLYEYLTEDKGLTDAEIEANYKVQKVGDKIERIVGVQSRFLSSSEDEVLFSGGRGSGKSDCLIVDPLRYCGNSNFRGLIIRKTMPELRELINRAKVLYPQVYRDLLKKNNRGWKEQEKLFEFSSGAKIEFGYASTIDDLLRYQGQQYTWLGVDEITQHATEEVLDKLKASLRSTDPDLPIHIRCTTNPSGPGVNWVRKRWVDLAPPEKRATLTYGYSGSTETFDVTRKWFQSTIDDNPTLMRANPNYKASLASITNENLRNQWAYGDWDSIDGMAFPEFSREQHVVKPFKIPAGWHRFRACDWGYADKAVCLWFAVDYDNNIYVYREYASNGNTGRKQLVEEFANSINELESDESVHVGYIDGSVWAKRGDMTESIGDTMLRINGGWMPADRSPGSRVAGKMQIHKYLTPVPTGMYKDGVEIIDSKVKIFNTCTELIGEMGTIPLDDKNPEDVDTKAEDHAYDTFRYGLASRPDIFTSMRDTVFGSRQSDNKPIIIDTNIGI